jgi:hypothetical protein
MTHCIDWQNAHAPHRLQYGVLSFVVGFPGSWFRVGETSFQAPLFLCGACLLILTSRRTHETNKNKRCARCRPVSRTDSHVKAILERSVP